MEQLAFDFEATDGPRVENPFREACWYRPGYADFVLFHEEHPHVLARLRADALALKARGHRRYGMRALIEPLRWDASMTTNGKPYKFNNAFIPLYARLLMLDTPTLRGFFQLK